jgi:hypothetical protein
MKATHIRICAALGALCMAAAIAASASPANAEGGTEVGNPWADAGRAA